MGDASESGNMVIPGAYRPVPVPPYVQMKPEAAKYWPLFTCGREAGLWLPVELLTVAKLCQMEADLHAWRAQVEREGLVVDTPNGGIKAHPLLTSIVSFQRLQLALMRPLSMMLVQHDSDPGGAGKRRESLKQGIKQGDGGTFLEID